MLKLEIIRLLIDRILTLNFDDMAEMVTELCWVEDQTDAQGNVQKITIDQMLWVDRMFVYGEIWRTTLNMLYKEYLPEKKYETSWIAEITPYTLLQCSLVENDSHASDAFKKYIEMGMADDQNLHEMLKGGYAKLGIDINTFSPALLKYLPNEPMQQYILLYRLLNFPPLRELSLFFKTVHQKYTSGLRALTNTFSSKKELDLPTFQVTEPFHLSVLYFNHKIFEIYGLDWMEQQPELSKHTDAILAIRQKASSMEGKFTGNVICGCCGTIHEASVPVGILQYKFLFEHNELAKDVGYLLFDEIKESFLKDLTTKFMHIVGNLNPEENADLLILVEGASEETGIPILAFKRRIFLFNENIKVYNSGSKEQLVRDFKAFKSKFKHLKMICLLDSDAKKEKAELERLMMGHKNKYDLVFIKKGTWEDLFPLAQSIDALNDLYSEGEAILESDFDLAKEFAREADRILWQKKKAKFDKIKFSEKICWGLDAKTLPDTINTILDLAEKLLPRKDNIFKDR